MSDPRFLLVAGDTHGDPEHLVWLYEQAIQGADAIVQVGDYGYWEHMKDGEGFLDLNSDLATSNDMPLYWIDGNHECHPMLRSKYGPGGSNYKPTAEGFWEIRPGVYYIPRGTRWEWSGAKMIGLGGANSVDKAYRIRRDREDRVKAYDYNARLDKYGSSKTRVKVENIVSWWAEEQLTDEDVARALVDSSPVDIMFTHDKPRSADPGWGRREIADNLPNQDKISKVVNVLTPKLLIHGHLHLRYTTEIRCGNDGKYTTVVGLDCNPDPSLNSQKVMKHREDSIVTLDLAMARQEQIA